MASFVTNMI